MKTQTQQTCYRYSSYLGCFLLLLPAGMDWYWGNIVIYTDSYFRVRLGPDSGFQTPWTISLFQIMLVTGFAVSSFTTSYFSHRQLCILAGLTLWSGQLASYFTVQHSVAALVATAGGVAGLGGGLAMAQVLEIVPRWSPPHQLGLATSVCFTGLLAGPMVMNYIITFYMNPTDMKPDLVEGSQVYFTQECILTKVPSIFLILLGATMVYQISAILLIKDVSYATENVSEMSVNSTADEYDSIYTCTADQMPFTEQQILTTEEPGAGHHDETQISCRYGSMQIIEKHVTVARGNQTFGSTSSNDAVDAIQTNRLDTSCELPMTISETVDKSSKSDTCKTLNQSMDGNSRRDCSQRDNVVTGLTITEVLKTPIFYTLLCYFLCGNYSGVIMSNYFKKFGLYMIKNDHFVSLVINVTLLGQIVCKVLMGSAIDVWGVKNTIAFLLSNLSLVSVFWYFSPLPSRWLYMVCTVIFGGLGQAVQISVPISIIKIFSLTQSPRIYVMLLTSALLLNFVGPYLIGLILQTYGWFYLFLTNAAADTIGLVLVLAFLPSNT